MGFSVDTGALDEFADFLSYFGDDAGDVRAYFERECTMSAHGDGMLDIILGGHAAVMSGMAKRTDLLCEAANGSSKEISSSSWFYQHTDKKEVERLDATYPAVSGDSANPASGSSGKGTFKYHSAYDKLKVDTDKLDEQVEPGAVEDWARNVTGLFSITGAVRAFLKNVCGFDPFDWVRQWFLGDWREWGKCELVWDACGNTVNEMGDNLPPATSKLAEVWHGVAADTAVDYFTKFTTATKVEGQAFKALAQGYRLYMKVIYDAQQALDDALNTVLDLVLDILMLPEEAAAGGVVGVVDLVGAVGGRKEVWSSSINKVLNIIGTIGDIVAAVADTCHLFGDISDLADLPDIPACQIGVLPHSSDDGATRNAFDHPDETV